MTADAVLRASVADLPVPPLPTPSFVRPPDLSGARVAVVNTAGLMRPGDAAWTHDDHRFRVFERRERDVLQYLVPLSQIEGDREHPPWRLAEIPDDD